MGQDTFLRLPGKFEAGKNYLLKGETLIAWRKALLADRILPGMGLMENGTPTGRVLSVIQPDTGVCPFHGYRREPGIMRIAGGRLIISPASGELAAITGLDTDIPLSNALKVSLYVSMDENFAITAAQVYGATNWATPVTWEGTYPDQWQTSACIRIGEVTADKLPEGIPGFEFMIEGVLYHFEQYLHTHLFMALVAYDGKAALMPLPWAG